LKLEDFSESLKLLIVYSKLFWSKSKFIANYLNTIESNIEGKNFVGIVMEYVDGKVYFLFIFYCKIFRIWQHTVTKQKLIWIICYWFSLKQVCFVFIFILIFFLVCALRDVHKYGYVHNDLKLDNFVVRETNGFFFLILLIIIRWVVQFGV
jgi:serine/threonine protein kinase